MATVDVRIPTILRPNVGGAAKVKATGDTLGVLIKDLTEQFPALASQILTDTGDLHKFVNVYVNDDDARYIGKFDAPIKDGDTVSILNAVAGGA